MSVINLFECEVNTGPINAKFKFGVNGDFIVDFAEGTTDVIASFGGAFGGAFGKVTSIFSAADKGCSDTPDDHPPPVELYPVKIRDDWVNVDYPEVDE